MPCALTRLLADVGRQVLIRRDEFAPPSFGVAALAPGEVGGEILGVDLPAGSVEGDRVQWQAPDLDDRWLAPGLDCLATPN